LVSDRTFKALAALTGAVMGAAMRRPDVDMALWANQDEGRDDVYTTVYFLRDALDSVLGHAGYLTAAVCRKPALVRGAGHAEIAARLNRFRSSYMELRTREAMLVTKLLRAREWAAELRRAAPQIRGDIDQFLDATGVCERLHGEYVSDPQRLFHGGEMPMRFLERRQASGEMDAGACLPAQDYRVGGAVDLLELRVACEVFLSQIDQEFFPDAPPAPLPYDEGAAAFLPLHEDELVPVEEPAPAPVH
jgi:hypothetical protein